MLSSIKSQDGGLLSFIFFVLFSLVLCFVLFLLHFHFIIALFNLMLTAFQHFMLPLFLFNKLNILVFGDVISGGVIEVNKWGLHTKFRGSSSTRS